MRLSVSGKTQGLLRKLQSRPSRNVAHWFPRCVGEEYSPLWDSFSDTRVVKDLIKQYGLTSLCQYYAASLFLSYLSKYTKVPNLGSDELYDPTAGRDAIRSLLSATRIVDKLNLKYHSHALEFTATEVDWLRCAIDIQCQGVLTYKLSGRKPLDAYLGSLSPSVFKSIPVELRSDKPFGEKPVRKQKLLTPAQQLKSTYGWVTLPCDGAAVALARSRYNTIQIRYNYGVPGVYPYGSEAPEALLRRLRTKHEILAKTLQ